MDILLVLDTSGGACTACVYDVGKDTVLASAYETMPYGQATHIVPMVDVVVERSGISHNAVDAIGVCNGPGYFTGMRIGMSTAQGLALGLGVPIYGVSSLQAMAYQSQCTQDLTVIMESKRADCYVQSFENMHPTTDILCLEPSHIVSKSHVVGSGLHRYENHGVTVIPCCPYPHAIYIACAIVNGLREGDSCLAEPMYLRAPDVHPPKTL